MPPATRQTASSASTYGTGRASATTPSGLPPTVTPTAGSPGARGATTCCRRRPAGAIASRSSPPRRGSAAAASRRRWGGTGSCTGGDRLQGAALREDQKTRRLVVFEISFIEKDADRRTD